MKAKDQISYSQQNPERNDVNQLQARKELLEGTMQFDCSVQGQPPLSVDYFTPLGENKAALHSNSSSFRLVPALLPPGYRFANGNETTSAAMANVTQNFHTAGN
jgi:hypothetical protein